MHEMCPEIPTHYEGVIHTKRKAYDVVSDMYPTHEQVENVGKGTHKELMKNCEAYREIALSQLSEEELTNE